MKTKLTALALAAATALSLAPKPATAGDKELAIVGGLIGGLIIAAAISDNHHDVYPVHGSAVIVAGSNNHHAHGYWKSVSVRVWVPGCWVSERGHHGRTYRRYREGHYEYRTDRVWVSHGSRDGYARAVGSGYGRR
jgi:hypothetical protein